MKSIYRKGLILCVALVFASAMNIFIPKTSLTNRGIVVSLGIDCEGDVFTVSAQLVMGKSSSGSSGTPNAFVVVQGKSKSLTECLSNIEKQSGTKQGYRHCTVIVLGGSIIDNRQADYIVNYFFSESNLPDNVLIGVVEGSAADFVATEAAMTTSSGFHIRRLLNPQHNAIGIMKETVKDYAISLRHLLPSNYLPVIDITQSPDIIDKQSGENPTGALFSITRSVYISGNKVLYLDSLYSLAASMLYMDLSNGNLTILTDTERLSLTVIKLSTDAKADMDEMQIEIQLTASLKLEELSSNGRSSSNGADVDEAHKQIIKDYLSGAIYRLYDYSRETDCDLLDCYNMMYTQFGDKWVASAPDDYLQHYSVKVNVKLQVE